MQFSHLRTANFGYRGFKQPVSRLTLGIRQIDHWSPYWTIIVLMLIALVFASPASAQILENSFQLDGGVGEFGAPLAVDEKTGRVLVGARQCVDNICVATNPNITVLSGDLTSVFGELNLPSEEGWRPVAALALDSGRRHLFTATFSGVWVADLDRLTVLELIPIPGVSVLGFNPATNVLYASDSTSFHSVNLSLPSGDAQRIQRIADVGFGAVVCDVNTNLIYLSSWSSSVVTVVDGDPLRPTWNQVIGSIPLAVRTGGGYGNPPAMALNRQTRRLYVGGWASGVRIWPDGRELPATAPAVAVIDLDPMSPSHRTTIAQFFAVLGHLNTHGEVVHDPFAWFGEFPLAIAVNPLVNRLYVSMTEADHWPRYYLTTVDGVSSTQSSIYDITSGWQGFKGFVVVNPAAQRIYMHDARFLYVFKDETASQMATAAGNDIQPVTVTSPQAVITFADVTESGDTSVVPIDEPAALPGQFELAGGPAYEISTSATFSGPITICFNASSVSDPAAFEGLAVLHAEGGVWVDRTVSRDFNSGTVCASVTSFSPFAVVLRKPYVVKPLYDTTKSQEREHCSNSNPGSGRHRFQCIRSEPDRCGR